MGCMSLFVFIQVSVFCVLTFVCFFVVSATLPLSLFNLTPPPPPPPFSVYKETHPNRQLFTIFTYTIICITTVSSFSLVLRSSQEKSKTVVMQFFLGGGGGGGGGRKQGALWSMWKWWIGRGNVTETTIAVLQVNVFDHSDPHSM